MAESESSLGVLAAAPQTRIASAWSPFREPLFRNLWVASVISYSGTWMQNIGTGWLMTSLTTSPMMIGLVQAAMSLPVFLVVLPAGALADMVDRRKLLIAAQIWMLVAAAVLGVLTIMNMVTPSLLLLLTFLLGFGAVMNDPAWQAITPDVVSPHRFASAVALNSAGFNVARAIGPALGGIVIAVAGSGPAFMLNAASFLGVIGFLYTWKSRPHREDIPAARIMEYIKAGIAHVCETKPVQSVLVRTGLFSLFASAFWALLPIVASPHGPIAYGILLASFGTGALAGAAILQPLRHRININALVAGATIIFAFAIVAFASVDDVKQLCLILLVAGMSWIIMLASLNISAQQMSPAWLRARSLSMYLLVLQGGMAAGSAAWGAVASQYGVPFALRIAGIGLLLGLTTIGRHRLKTAPASLA
jgi:predicted MFS family arabinose efflux permease